MHTQNYHCYVTSIFPHRFLNHYIIYAALFLIEIAHPVKIFYALCEPFAALRYSFFITCIVRPKKLSVNRIHYDLIKTGQFYSNSEENL